MDLVHMTRFWLVLWAVALSIAWVLPNHYAPWSTFHMDAWSAIVLITASGVVVLPGTRQVPIYRLTVLAGLVTVIPMVQYSVSLIDTLGTAWVSTAYLLGFLLALVTGASWEISKPGQLLDGLFVAVGLASIVSVGLQIHQWLSLDLLGVWSMGDGYGRPFGNFGQPNQLATLLLWGVIAAAWGYSQRHLGGFTAVLMAVFLFLGVALTQSRTAWIGVFLIVSFSWIWRGRWTHRATPRVVTAMAIVFLFFCVSIDYLDKVFLLVAQDEPGAITRIAGELRPTIWRLFIDGSLREPIWGYGWNQVGWAQIEVAIDHPPLHQLFTHSHNFFLDLILWCGWPMGGVVAIALIRWLWMRFQQVRSDQDILLALFVLVIANHAMFELPLHHAYFLMPTGLVMGCMAVRGRCKAICYVSRQKVMLLWMLTAIFLGLIVRDYSKIETAYQGLRFEWAGLKPMDSTPIPALTVLTNFSDYFEVVRFEPNEHISQKQVKLLETTTKNFPGPGFFEKYAYALAITGKPEEAVMWLQRMCQMIPKEQCATVRSWWASQAANNAALKAATWAD